jgi:antitoxin YefM
MSIVPFTEARNHLSELIEEVARTHERIVITRHGNAVAILLSPDDLESLEETLDVLSSPESMRQLAESREALRSGEMLDADELAELLSQRSRASRRSRRTK